LLDKVFAACARVSGFGRPMFQFPLNTISTVKKQHKSDCYTTNRLC
jgi:hypothetical protein